MRHQGSGALGSALSRIRYITQVKSRPPTFAVFVAGGMEFKDDAKKFLARALQQDLDFQGVPIRVEVRRRTKAETRQNPRSRNDSRSSRRSRYGQVKM